MIRALITGATGGLGANLIAALNAERVEVVAMRRSTSPDAAIEEQPAEWAVGDVLDTDSLAAAMRGVDWVFHVAAIADDWNHPAERVYAVNVEGTRNVLQAACDAGVSRFVYTSSSSALGVPEREGQLLDESNTYNLPPDLWPYGHSKHLAEGLVREAAAEGLPALSLLPVALMGPRDVKFISGELIVRALKRQLMPFPEGGLSFLDTRDCAAAHVAAAQVGRPGERYVLAGENLPHRQAVEIIGQALGVPIRYVRIPRWSLPAVAAGVALAGRLGVKLPVERARVLLSGKYVYYDAGKARAELGLQARPFAESVRDAYSWYRDHGFFARRGIPPEALPDLTEQHPGTREEDAPHGR